jgi:predicted Zn-dependent protease
MSKETAEELFNQGLERYKAGEDAATLIPIFKDICDQSPKVASSWICLSWLYLVNNQPTLALKAAQKSVKLNPEDPQARINLAIAMLDTSQPGVREHVQLAAAMLMVMTELKTEIIENFEDGLRRRPNWSSLERVKKWILE